MLTRRLRTPAKAQAFSLICIVVSTLFLAGTLAPPVRAASTIHVPQDYLTIQMAINAASPGDTIIVNSATYQENLVIGKSLNLTGVSASSTIINGTNSGPGITIANTTSVIVSGFTIRGTGFY